MVYHGVDLVEVDRIAQAVTRWGHRFLERVFTSGELRDAGGRIASLAARFAAKEAAAKALGAGLRGLGAPSGATPVPVGWHEIEVVRLPTGQPSLQLHGRAGERAAALGWHSISISLSHTRANAMASVVALGRPSITIVLEP